MSINFTGGAQECKDGWADSQFATTRSSPPSLDNGNFTIDYAFTTEACPKFQARTTAMGNHVLNETHASRPQSQPPAHGNFNLHQTRKYQGRRRLEYYIQKQDNKPESASIREKPVLGDLGALQARVLALPLATRQSEYMPKGPLPRLPDSPPDCSQNDLELRKQFRRIYEDRMVCYMHHLDRYPPEIKARLLADEEVKRAPPLIPPEEIDRLRTQCGPFFLIGQAHESTDKGVQRLRTLYDVVKMHSHLSRFVSGEPLETIRRALQGFLSFAPAICSPCIIIAHQTRDKLYETIDASRNDYGCKELYQVLGQAGRPLTVLALSWHKELEDCLTLLPQGSTVFTATGLGFLGAKTEFWDGFFPKNVPLLNFVFCSILYGSQGDQSESLHFVQSGLKLKSTLLSSLLKTHEQELKMYNYRPYLYDDTLEQMKSHWPHHVSRLNLVYELIMRGDAEQILDDPSATRSAVAFVLGLAIESALPQALTKMPVSPSRPSIWRQKQRYFVIQGPGCDIEQLLSPSLTSEASSGYSEAVSIWKCASNTWFNESEIGLQWSFFQQKLSPDDIICVLLVVKTEIKQRERRIGVFISNDHGYLEADSVLRTFTSHHWVNLVLVAQHAANIAAHHSASLPDRSCLLACDVNDFKGWSRLIKPTASFFGVCLEGLMHKPPANRIGVSMQLRWTLESKRWHVVFDDEFAAGVVSKIFTSTNQEQVLSFLREELDNKDASILEQLYTDVISCGNKGKDLLARQHTIALAFAFEIFGTVDVVGVAGSIVGDRMPRYHERCSDEPDE